MAKKVSKGVETTKTDKTADPPKAKKVVKKSVIDDIGGRPKSGRIWKSTKTRFSSVTKVKGTKQPHEKKQALRIEIQRAKAATRAIQEEKRIEKEARKERRRDNLKRAEENRKRAEVVQVITNTAKLKRMKKKQLRYIEKRDTTKVT